MPNQSEFGEKHLPDSDVLNDVPISVLFFFCIGFLFHLHFLVGGLEHVVFSIYRE